jgi:arylsulfatase A-like enzyme
MSGSPLDWGFDEDISDPTAGGWFWKQFYLKNGKTVKEDKEVYYPDVCHKFALDFIDRNKDKPFFLYYASHLVHAPILRTPDSKPGGNLYAENIAYLDKQVGDLVAHLEKLGLREKTLIVFSSDNGTARQSRTVHGRALSGSKGSMWEGGAHVPFIVSWPGVTPAGKATNDLVDFSDLFPTFAGVAGAKMPEGVIFDGKSFLPRLKDQAGTPREWIFVQLGRNWFVRDSRWKLDESGNLYDMKDAPYTEKAVPADASDEAAKAARQRLGDVLAKLNPATGKSEPQGKGKMNNKKRQRKMGRAAAAP